MVAAAAPTVEAGAKAAAATTSESSSSQAGDLAIGIIVIIAIAAFAFFIGLGFICFCVRRRKTKRRRDALLATAKVNAENIRLSQQNMYPQYPSQENSVYHPDQATGFVAEMPSMHSPAEVDGQERFPSRASEMYSPPTGRERFARGPPSSELDGNYGGLPLRPDSDVTAPMLGNDHEQTYSNSWEGDRRGR